MPPDHASIPTSSASANAAPLASSPSPSADGERRFDQFLVADEVRALRSVAWVRFVFVAILVGLEALPYLFQAPFRWPADLYAFVVKLGFLPVGIVQWWLASSGRYRPWMKYVLLAADVAWLGFYQVVPNPWELAWAGPAFVTEAVSAHSHQSLKWLWLFFVWVSFGFSAAYVRAFGVFVVLAWLLQLLWLSALPGTVMQPDLAAALGHPAQGGIASQAGFVDVGITADNILVTFFLTLGFTYVAANNRRLVARFFASEQRRSALARYFSPNLVDKLADAQTVPAPVQTDAAVLFIDIRGYTTFALDRAPAEVLVHLQAFHALMEAEVFARDGTLEKYIGDAVLAVFGAPLRHADDARRALDCAQAMLSRIDEWNRERAAQGEPPVAVGIGLDYGAVVGGVIGGVVGRERNMSYAVVGATVNRASRLQGLTREMNADIIMSQSFFEAVGEPAVRALAAQAGLQLRQRTASLRHLPDQTVWLLARSSMDDGAADHGAG
ncbi:adenylate/guanylate cyclase domain-containing protein [Uliginosibacterium sp. H1]|uniref:adenylate/guanylate cyclase domain-containing protein n=1 Tax=Uliginosibacterium sp. H1 TaxID=3114757 RepID=UPI002E16DAFF|nr:adenylate/guanylate cyclase domain-containing protein [Uliginosibacterium sp. H1]